jgi:hypothetical protein
VGYEDFDEGEDISWDELADGILEVYTKRVTPLNIIYNLIASAFLPLFCFALLVLDNFMFMFCGQVSRSHVFNWYQIS